MRKTLQRKTNFYFLDLWVNLCLLPNNKTDNNKIIMMMIEIDKSEKKKKR